MNVNILIKVNSTEHNVNSCIVSDSKPTFYRLWHTAHIPGKLTTDQRMGDTNLIKKCVAETLKS
jgi:hypothetical protein